MLLQKSCEKNAKIYVCELCDYTTSRKSSYDKHLITAKHMNTTANYISTTTLQPQVAQPYICNCGKEYKHHSSLWNHKKKCSVNIQPTTTECDNADEKDDELHNNSNLIIEILKQNQEFKEMILEDIIKAGKEILNFGPKFVLIKGGHTNKSYIEDVLISKNNIKIFKNKKIKTKNTHGTGCTLSSAIASFISKNYGMNESCRRSIQYVHKAILLNPKFGRGHGPINHMALLN